MNIRNFMEKENLRYLLVNSTNEFLVEYNSLEENSRYKLTNFSGSTGEALVTPQNIYLFVDGRYHIQADLEVNHNLVEVVKLQQGQIYLDELIKKIPGNEILGVFSKKNSQDKIEKISKQRQIKLLDSDPFDENVLIKNPADVVIDDKYAGLNSDEKIGKISADLKESEAIYVTDLDEVSYLFNMRNFETNYSSKIRGKALIFKDRALLFKSSNMNELYEILKTTKHKIYIDKTLINAYDFNLIKDRAVEFKINPIKQMKSCKNQAEIAHLKDAFERTDKAVSAIRDYIYSHDNISEYDIEYQLWKEFEKQGAKNLSFKSIVARNKNSALAHYSKSSKEEIIMHGDLVLIDCGAYFEGGLATDITRVFVKGEPTQEHKKIYTFVLKAFLRAFNYLKQFNKKSVTGFEIDNYVREFFDRQDLDGFIFNHGLGHGIGVNVHEYPPSLSSGELAKVSLLEGECFSIEPGLYKQGEFGVRLENSCYFSEGEIHSFVHMNYEKKLIDFDLLDEQEKLWLNDFEVK